MVPRTPPSVSLLKRVVLAILGCRSALGSRHRLLLEVVVFRVGPSYVRRISNSYLLVVVKDFIGLVTPSLLPLESIDSTV